MELTNNFKHGGRPNLNGRPKGAVSKSTQQRTDEFRKKLDETNIYFMLIDKLIERIENDSIKTAEVIAALSKLTPYGIQSVAMDQIAENIQGITNAEEALKVAEQLKDTVRYLKAV